MFEKIKNFFLTNKYNIFLFIIFLVGILIRTINVANYPNALNVDEASAGYEAYSLLTTGHDRNGNLWPAFFVSWGSGQNVLLSYLMIPFIAILGLNTISVRLPMVIIGCISLFVFYLLLKKISNKKLAIIGLAFFAICPWHIMKSRWGLESNLFPDLVLFFIYFFVKGIMDKKKNYFYLSFIIAGLSAYAYSTAYLFLPIFIIPLLIFYLIKKEIKLKQIILGLLIIVIITLPLILFTLISIFDLPQINLPFITIPKLSQNRYETITALGSENFFVSCINNFTNGIKMLLLQTDNLPWNSLEGFGTIYLFSIIFTIIGFINCFFNKKLKIKHCYILNSCFISSLVLMFICEPNINRLNIIFIPIIYYTVIGIYLIIENSKKIVPILITVIYCIIFLLFTNSYFKQDWNNYFTFENNIEEVINYISKLDNKQIYITNKIKEPYIYVLFYSNYSPIDFNKSVEYYNANVGLRQVKHFGNYYFGNIENIILENNNYAYVIKKEDLKKYYTQKNEFKITEFEKYVVIEEAI